MLLPFVDLLCPPGSPAAPWRIHVPPGMSWLIGYSLFIQGKQLILVNNWQGEGKRTALPRFTNHPDPTAMKLYQTARDG
jgi:hypothetical protein